MKYILYYGLALPAISLLASLLIVDFRRGGVSLKQTPFRIRAISLALFLFLSVIDLCVGPPEASGGAVLMNLQMSGAILLLSPHSYAARKRDNSSVFAAALASLCLMTALAGALAGAPVWKERLFPLIAVGALAAHNFLCLKMRFGNVRTLFQNRAVWHSIEDYAYHLYVILLLSSVCLVQIHVISRDLFSAVMLLPALALVSAAVYGAYRKSMDSSIVFLTEKQRIQIENTMAGNDVERSGKVNPKMQKLFAKIEKYIAEHKPYLQDNFSLGDLATAVLSNRVYVSRTINKVTGNNFSNLMNGYRVAHSQMLWKLNPGLRLKEIYSRCGFHNMPSFIKAFKDSTGCTPVEWLKETQVEKLSSRPAGKKLAA